MNSPDTPRPTVVSRAKFKLLIDEAAAVLPGYRNDPVVALNSGVDPALLIRLCQGNLSSHELLEANAMLISSPWAHSRVVALIKARRNPSSFGAKILASTQLDPYAWGMKNTGDRDMDLAQLLETL